MKTLILPHLTPNLPIHCTIMGNHYRDIHQTKRAVFNTNVERDMSSKDAYCIHCFNRPGSQGRIFVLPIEGVLCYSCFFDVVNNEMLRKIMFLNRMCRFNLINEDIGNTISNTLIRVIESSVKQDNISFKRGEWEVGLMEVYTDYSYNAKLTLIYPEMRLFKRLPLPDFQVTERGATHKIKFRWESYKYGFLTMRLKRTKIHDRFISDKNVKVNFEIVTQLQSKYSTIEEALRLIETYCNER